MWPTEPCATGVPSASDRTGSRMKAECGMISLTCSITSSRDVVVLPCGHTWRSTMSVNKRGSVWHYDFAVAGRRFRDSTKERTLSRARMIEAMLIARVREQAPSLIPQRAPLLRDFAPRFLKWVEECRLEPGTKLYYKKGWHMLKPTDLLGRRLDEITTDVAARLQFRGSPANINRALRTQRRMLGKAAEWGLLRVAPRIQLVKEHGRGVLIDQDAEMKLLAVA